MTRCRVGVGVLMAACCLFGTVAQAEIRWEKDLEAALQKAAQSQRLVLVHFWDDGCLPCAKMEQKVFRNAEVGRVVSLHFIPVKVNVRQHPELRERFGVEAWPTDVVLDGRGREVYRGIPRPDPRHFLATLSNVAVHARSRQNIPRGDARSNWGQPDGSTTASARNSAFVPPASSSASTPSPTNHAPHSAIPPQVVQNRFANAGGPPVSAPTSPRTNLGPAVPTAGPYGQQIVDPRSGAATPMRQSHPLAAQPPAAHPPAPSGPPAPSRPTPPSGPPARNAVAAQPAAAPAHPPIGLDGYCPVTLVKRETWTKGDARYGAIHRGRTYLFASKEAQQEFLADPDRFAPMLSELDVVELLENHRYVVGKREHGVFHRGRIYLFANEEDLAKFSQQPDRYHQQAMQILSRAPSNQR